MSNENSLFLFARKLRRVVVAEPECQQECLSKPMLFEWSCKKKKVVLTRPNEMKRAHKNRNENTPLTLRGAFGSIDD